MLGASLLSSPLWGVIIMFPPGPDKPTFCSTPAFSLCMPSPTQFPHQINTTWTWVFLRAMFFLSVLTKFLLVDIVFPFWESLPFLVWSPPIFIQAQSTGPESRNIDSWPWVPSVTSVSRGSVWIYFGVASWSVCLHISWEVIDKMILGWPF